MKQCKILEEALLESFEKKFPTLVIQFENDLNCFFIKLNQSNRLLILCMDITKEEQKLTPQPPPSIVQPFYKIQLQTLGHISKHNSDNSEDYVYISEPKKYEWCGTTVYGYQNFYKIFDTAEEVCDEVEYLLKSFQIKLKKTYAQVV
jgi:hypothetical protein